MKFTIRQAALTAFLLIPMTAFASAPKAGVTEKTLLDTYHEGGWVMHFLLLFSIAMVWLVQFDLPKVVWLKESLQSLGLI